MRLDTFGWLPGEDIHARHLHPWCEIFADRFRVCDDCQASLRAETGEYCRQKNEQSNESACLAYRAGLLP